MARPTAPEADAKLWWAQRSTRWDPYPQREPVKLVAHDWWGTWEPLPDGHWFLSPEPVEFVAEAYSPALFGEWRASAYDRAIGARNPLLHFERRAP